MPITQNTDKCKISQNHSNSTCKRDSYAWTKPFNIAVKSRLAFYTLKAQLCLQIVFAAVWAQPPSVFETFVARRERFERLSLPLGSNFLITAPPECSFTLFLWREECDKAESTNREEGKLKKKERSWVKSKADVLKQQMAHADKNL